MPTYCKVKRTLLAQQIDSWDADTLPESAPLHGNITFTPQLADGDAVTLYDDGKPVTIVPTPIQARISDGQIFHRGVDYIELLAGGDRMNPATLVWKATFTNLQSSGVPVKLRPVIFEAVPNGTVDLTIVAPAPGTAGQGVVRGRDGDQIEGLTVEGTSLVLRVKDGDGVIRSEQIAIGEVAKTVANDAVTRAELAAGSASSSQAEAGASARAAKVSEGNAKVSEDAAGSSASTAVAKAGEALASASAAKTSETNAKTSETSADSSATSASGSKNAAAASAKAAKASEDKAKASESAAKQSETNAASSATAAADARDSAQAYAGGAQTQAQAAQAQGDRAKSEADKAASSATKAESEATRATNVVGTTRWNGDKLTVNGVTSPSLTGPKGAVEPGVVVPLPRKTVDLSAAIPAGATGYITLNVNGGVATLLIASIVVAEQAAFRNVLPYEGIPLAYRPSANTFAPIQASDGAIATLNVQSSGGVSLDNFTAGKGYRGSVSWSINSDVSAMSGPAGPAGPPGTTTWGGLTDKPDLTKKADLVGGQVPTSQLPAVALVKPNSVTDRAGMLALAAQEGDVAVISSGADKGTYMLGSGSPASFNSWVKLVSPDAPVQSVNGQTGTVNLTASNVEAASATHTHAVSDVTGLQAALDGKASTATVNARPALFSGAGAPPSTIAGAVVGDWWLNITTMELSKITGV